MTDGTLQAIANANGTITVPSFFISLHSVIQYFHLLVSFIEFTLYYNSNGTLRTVIILSLIAFAYCYNISSIAINLMKSIKLMH